MLIIFISAHAEEQQKLTQEYQEYQRKLEQQKEDYRKEHPDAVSPLNFQFYNYKFRTNIF